MDSINMQEYSEKLRQVQSGIISEDKWIEYCSELMEQVLEDAKDVMFRMKERGD
jgi:hypothetical protein